MTLLPEPEVLIARKAFPDAQAAMEGLGVRFGDRFYTLGWYGTRVSAERGSFCVVNVNGELAGLVGDVLRFRYGPNRSALAYCVGSAALDFEVGVTRRVFAALDVLSLESIEVVVEVIA